MQKFMGFLGFGLGLLGFGCGGDEPAAASPEGQGGTTTAGTGGQTAGSGGQVDALAPGTGAADGLGGGSGGISGGGALPSGSAGTAATGGGEPSLGGTTGGPGGTGGLAGTTAGGTGGTDAGTGGTSGSTSGCPENQEECAGTCVDTTSSQAHCGGCDRACGVLEACSSGTCVCAAPAQDCGGTCVDTSSSGDHCGECNRSCGGQVCNAGECGASCDPLTQCGQSCVDLASDALHCGECDRPCPTGQTCAQGECACEGDLVDCGTGCIDTSADNEHCGECDNSCGEDRTCVGGTCACTGGFELCDDACVDLQTSPEHCGQCDAPCAGECVAGECQTPALTLVGEIERGSNYVLEFSDGTYFEVQRAGGRIMSFGLSDAAADNILDHSNADNYGSTLWTAPQSDWNWPPPEGFDNANFTVTVTGNVIEMEGPSTTVGSASVSLLKTFTPDLEGGAIDIVYTVRNEGSSSVELAVWEVSRVAQGGLTFFPEGGTPRLDSSRQPMTWTTSDGYIWFDEQEDGPSGGDGKLFADGSDGWMAHTDGEYLYLKQWPDVPGSDAADGEAEVEIYDSGSNGSLVELEVQGPAVTLGAGEETSLEMRWIVRPLTASAEVGDSGLIEQVLALVQ